MTTKNLARTVIEGGRTGYSRFARRYSNKVARIAAHSASSVVRRLDDYDEVEYEPRTPVRRDFDDKLRPALRWLRSQVGRPWNKIRSELFERFDTRTTAGRHIVFDHLLEEVLPYGEIVRWPHYYGFKVDARGILRVEKPRRFSSDTPRPALPESEEALLGWLGGRRIGAHGVRLYWFTSTRTGRFRQDRALDDVDAARWRALPDWFKERHDPQAPVLLETR